MPATVIAERLHAFDPGDGNPGRGMLFRRDGVHVLVDSAHNPAAIAAVSELLHRVWGAGRSVAVVTLPGDRRDDLLAESARVIAENLDRVVRYEDTDLRGRAPGEVPGLVRREIAAYRTAVGCMTVCLVADAITAALAIATPGDVVLVLDEKVEPVLELLAKFGAVSVTERSASALAVTSSPQKM